MAKQQPDKTQEEIDKTRLLIQQMQTMQDRMAAAGQSLDLINPDGTPNLGALSRFLRDDRYSEFRKQFKEETDQIRGSLRGANTQAGLSIASNAVKLAQGLRQVSQAKEISEELGQYPELEPQSRALQRSLGRRESLAQTGLTQQERAMADEQAAQNYQGQVRDVVNNSGGQGSAVIAGLQGAANNRARNNQAILAAATQARRQAEGSLSQSLGLEQQQRTANNQHNQYSFWTRDLNLFNTRQQQRQRLLDAGLYNTFSASDRIFGDTAALSGMYREQLPGYVYNNNYYNSGVNQQHSLAPVFNNPLTRMSMGNVPSGPSPAQLQQRYQGGYQGNQIRSAYPQSFQSFTEQYGQ